MDCPCSGKMKMEHYTPSAFLIADKRIGKRLTSTDMQMKRKKEIRGTNHPARL